MQIGSHVFSEEGKYITIINEKGKEIILDLPNVEDIINNRIDTNELAKANNIV